ncbi:MAG: collagen-like protein [Gordonia sp. (in: high G+C Gram-positive bacteria)]|uniref:collagen-like triple helix repeat-containing protein n=1 Tax=Gordonia sp. (in: high G+C Gram-positive bacteria) TaxID=84139 RepID=UPI003C7678EB
MGFLIRRSWNNRGGVDPTPWEKPVNQASKWLVAKSGTNRIEGEGGSVVVQNNESRKFLLSVFVGDGGTVNLGGTSGANTIQISRTGSSVTVSAQANSGGKATNTVTTEMPSDTWCNIYLKASVSGGLSNQITITAMVDFVTTIGLMSTGDVFGNKLNTGGKTLTCNSLAGWAWFGSTTGGFFGWGATSTVPISDAKYREAVLSNATWDIDSNTTSHTWNRPTGVRYLRAWLIQGGGGTGTSGTPGVPGSPGFPCTWGTPGSAGQPGARGGNDGEPGYPGSPGTAGGPPTQNPDGSCTDGSAGSAGAGGAGGAGGRGVMVQMVTTQNSLTLKAGTAGKNGGDGGHTSFGDVSSISAMPWSNGRSPASLSFGKTTFQHQLGGSDQPGGVVFYLQW